MAHTDRGSRLDEAAFSATPGPTARYALGWRGLAAFAFYLAFAALFFARGLLGHFSTAYIGKGTDPPQFIWLLAWWPHAIRHGLNPLYTRAVWAPQGVNLAWTMSAPLVNLAAIPACLGFGPVATYNALCLLAITLDAWCVFLLCRYVSGSYWPSLVGGYVFGFSAYVLGQAASHLNLLLVFPLALFALLLIGGFRADISRGTLVGGLVAVLMAQFLMFVEVFATMMIFTAIVLAALVIVGPSVEKRRTVGLLAMVALSYAITLLAVSPYLYYMLAFGYEPGALHPPLLYSTDLLNLFIPTQTVELGCLSSCHAISGRFLGNIYEAAGYVGLPLMLLAAIFARRYWSEIWGRLLVILLIAAVVLSLGPFLLVGGRPIMALPSALVNALPLIGKALPARLMLYAFLALALMTAIWLSIGRVSPRLRVLGAFLIVLSSLPNLSARFWTSRLDVPRFFSDGLYAKYLKRNETIVVLPYGINGQSMVWQLTSQWYFRMAGGYVGNPPLAFRRWPAVRAFYRVDTIALPAAGDQLRAFLAAHDASAVLVDNREEEVWRPLLATLGVAPLRAGGMTLYRVPAAELAPWANAKALEMETRADRARFAALVLAAEARRQAGESTASLTPTDVLKAGATPPGWVMVPAKVQPPYAQGGLNMPRISPNPHLFAGMWLRADHGDRIEVGVAGRYPALRMILDQYRAQAVEFAPHDLVDGLRGDTDDRRGMLVMTFNADGLARAAALAKAAADDGGPGH